MASQKTEQNWDIFCAVVDNYGDIGVTWRLAKQLAVEHQINVTLWVDDLNSFQHILPQLDLKKVTQTYFGIKINQWSEPLKCCYVAGDVLIEAFACELPAQVKQQLITAKQNYDEDTIQQKPPVWLNLEYLSAESWVEGCHGLPSMQSSGLKKYFYFPGFTDKTGGLICEQQLFAQRDAWQADVSNRLSLFESLGLRGIKTSDTVVSVFSYETTSLLALCQLWQHSEQTVHALIPKGRCLNSLVELLPCSVDEVSKGSQIKLNNLVIHILPMTDQEGYDKLLWSCDFNIVRGEDSFLRAQWAAKPFIWHIYVQEDDYHLIKLDAFMQLYCNNLPPELANSWKALNLAFNQGQADATCEHWQQLNLAGLPLQQHAKQWPIDAINDVDLVSRLVQFVKNS
ncbi:elongation factor P maturation arginine rhamnosyltransferase EarP [Shewanella marinintestina]|uniref:elongation factor P maturation arginine rhamnosyltransferase EarP n=1 Tax=Shewanella marinintestina TaxID=190305 RepID=UPI00200DBE6E|nr:elongation factor P maturation arginine rhamnosyltransferase EarP [Shewanella marinintestina]MCL1144513.1 elongation factor P maturation arginine rhamnosyltransferase EarP [Shewanella marinintestina]